MSRRRPWIAALAVLGALAGAAPARAQSGTPNDELQRRHLAAVRAERTTRLLAAWQAAPAERRAALGLLLDAAHAGRPIGRRPELDELARWTRVLLREAPDAAPDDPLALVADALDLQVVPGAFEPGGGGADGRGAPLVVWAYRLVPLALGGEATLTLDWLAPDGSRTRARSEPFGLGVFKPPGTHLFVRAPQGPSGVWQLAPSVSRDGRAVGGVPVPVPCADRLAGGAELGALLERGVRPVDLGRQGAPPRWSWWEDGPFEPALAACRLPAAGSEQRGALLVVLAPAGESSATLFAAELGARWERLAADGGHAVVALELGSSDGERLARGLSDWRAREPGRPLVLVARGDAMVSLGLASARAPLALDGLVLVGERIAFPAALAAVPTLAVRCAAADSEGQAAGTSGASEPRAGVEWLELELPDALFAEPELPEILGRWLESRMAAGGAR